MKPAKKIDIVSTFDSLESMSKFWSRAIKVMEIRAEMHRLEMSQNTKYLPTVHWRIIHDVILFNLSSAFRVPSYAHKSHDHTKTKLHKPPKSQKWWRQWWKRPHKHRKQAPSWVRLLRSKWPRKLSLSVWGRMWICLDNKIMTDMSLRIPIYTEDAFPSSGCGSSSLSMLQIPYPHLDDNSQATKMLKVIKTRMKKVAKM